MKINLIGINARYVHSCLALFYVRNELQRYCPGCEIELEQYTINDPYYELFLNISHGRSDYYFFSTVIWNSELVTKLVIDILKTIPESHCIVGGPQARVVAEDVGHSRCIAVIGEIEGVDTSFYGALVNKSLAGQYFCKKKFHEFTFPYDDTDYQLHLKNRHIYYESSRGCPFSCSYCLSSKDKGVKHKSVDLVCTELESILRHNPNEVKFVDRTFNDHMERSLAIWRFLCSISCDTTFHFEISPDRFTEEMFIFLETVPQGKFDFEIGIQTTHLESLQAINRVMDCEKAASNVKRLSAMGNIHLHVDLILGLPFDSKTSFLQSFRDVFAMEAHYIQMGLLKILPDTPLSHNAEKYSYISSKTAPYPVIANMWLDSQVVKELFWLGDCIEKFVNKRYFISFWDYIRGQGVDIALFFCGLQRMCQEEGFFKLAPTQKLLCEMLVQYTKNWEHSHYILEILRYDWLRYGHKFLPECLGLGEEQSSRFIKRLLFSERKKSCFSHLHEAERTYIFKKGFFLEFSKDVLYKLGYEKLGKRNFICFIPIKDGSIDNRCKSYIFSFPE